MSPTIKKATFAVVFFMGKPGRTENGGEET